MNQPSSTITAATLAGSAITLFWLLYGWLGWGPPAPEALVSFSTTFVASAVGYFKHEKVYPEGWKERG
jgi:hypothetical protein